jgi:RimJ/RimL family protein N-acetyltransferase
MNSTETRTYPRDVRIDGGSIDVRYMSPSDRDGILAFARALPPHDLLFLPRDITNPKVIDAWIREVGSGNLVSLVAIENDAIVGNATIVRDPYSWSPHVGELRVVVASSMRGRGLGRALTQECFALGLTLGLEKMVAQMTVDQKGALAVFETLGFRGEALLRDHVRDQHGTKHDIVMLSHDVRTFVAQLDAYGLPEAL